MFGLFKKKEQKPSITFKEVPGSKCPNCGETLRRVEGISDISLWCTSCGWHQIDYSLNKPSIY